MKILVIIGLIIGSSIAHANNELIGSWKLVDSYCEDGRILPQDSVIKSQGLIKNGMFRSFGMNGVTNMRAKFPSLFSSSICSVEASMGYEIKEDKIFISTENSKTHFYGCWTTSAVLSTVGWLSSSETPVTLSYDFVRNGDKLLMYQPLVQGATDFDCGRSIKVVEEYQIRRSRYYDSSLH